MNPDEQPQQPAQPPVPQFPSYPGLNMADRKQSGPLWKMAKQLLKPPKVRSRMRGPKTKTWSKKYPFY